MKYNSIKLVLLLTTILPPLFVPAYVSAATTHVSLAKGPKLDVKTEHNFSDLLINGKYQYPDEALIKVDDDKLLTDLIGYRKDFKDRLNRIGGGNGAQE